MSPRTFVNRGWALMALSTLAFAAACDRKVNVTVPEQPAPAIQVIVTPSNAEINVGGTQTFVAQVVGGDASTARTVTWSIQPATGVVSLTASGNTATVRGTARGTASIIATGPNGIAAAAAIVVRDTAGGTQPAGPPVITISDILQVPGGGPVDINNVFGRIAVYLNVDIPQGNQVNRVEVLLDGSVRCTQSVSSTRDASVAADASTSGTDQLQVICPIDTAQLDTTAANRGNPVFPNGPHTLSARLIAPSGNVLVSTSQVLNFNNPDVINLSISSTRGPTVNNNTGLTWRGGDLTVTATPVIFTGAANRISRVTISVQTVGDNGDASSCMGISTRSDTTAADGFRVTFPAANPLGGETSGRAHCSASTSSTTGQGLGSVELPVDIFVTGVTVSGQTSTAISGNILSSQPLGVRMDNLAPRIQRLALPTSFWINETFSFSAASSGTTTFARVVDFGVNEQTTTFRAGPLNSTTTALTVGGALPPSIANNAYIVAATATDKLGNDTTLFAANNTLAPVLDSAQAQTFGVDTINPTLTQTQASVANGSAFGAPNGSAGQIFQVAFADTGSVGVAGFGVNPVRTTIIRQAPLLTDPVSICAIGDENPAMASGDADTVCEPVSRTGTEPVTGTFPAGTPGYYTFTATAVDQAGNSSNTITITSLDDVVPPQTGGVVGPAIITGNQAVTFNTLATDNIDLNRATPFVTFPNVGTVGNVSLEFPSTQLGTYGPDVFTTSAAPQVTIAQFIKSIQQFGTGTVSGAQSVGMIITDQASNAVTANSDISAAVRGDTANVYANRTGGATVTGWEMLLPANTTLCNGTTQAGGPAGQPCPTNPTATTVQARLTTAAGATVPFQRVVFYAVAPSGRSILLGQGGLSITDTGGVRTVTYTGSFNANGLATGAYTVFALGVDNTGSALMTSNATTITVAQD